MMLTGKEFELFKILNARRKSIPDPAFIMVDLKREWGQADLMRWVIEHSVGDIYLTHNKIGFKDSIEAMMFTLKFK